MIDSNFFERVFEASPTGSLLLLPDPPKFTIVAVNLAYSKQAGILPENLIGKGIFEAFPPNPDSATTNDLSTLQESLDWVIRSGKPHKMETVRYDLPSGENEINPASYWDAENIPIKDEVGSVCYILHTVADVTIKSQTAQEMIVVLGGMKKAKEKLETANRLLKNAQHIVRMGNWEYDTGSDQLFCSDELYRIFELKKMDHTPLRFADFLRYLHPDDIPRVLAAKKNTKENEVPLDVEYRLLLDSGEEKIVHELGIVEFNDETNSFWVLGTLQDITRRKREEQHLKLLESVITHTNDAVLITEAEPFDEPGPRIVYVNEAFTRMTGYTAEEVIGKTPRILQGPKSDRIELAKLGGSLRKWKRHEVTTLNYKKNGEAFWINFTVSPVADEKGCFTHWIAIERDVTQSKNKESQKALLAEISLLFKSDNELNKTLEKVLEQLIGFGDFGMAEAWLIGSDPGRMKRVAHFSAKASGSKESNPKLHMLKGEGLIGKVWQEKSIQYEVNHLEQTICALPILHNKEVIGVFVLEVAGLEAGNAQFTYLFENLGNLAGADIKQKQLEQELHQIFSFAPDIICIAGTDGYFKKINRKASLLLEYTEEELLAVPYIDFVHPEDREKTEVETRNQAFGTPIVYFENRYLTKWGKVKWLAWTTTPSPEEGLFFAVGKDMTDKKELEDLLNKASSLARIGGWDLDLVKGSLYWSDITKEIHEVPLDFDPTLEVAIQFYKEGINRNTILEKMKSAMEKNIPWDVELQIVTANGQEKWVRSIGEATFNNGKCIKVYGSFQDIDAQKKAERAVSAAFEEKNTILESIGDAFFAVDREWTVTYWNSQAERMLEKPKVQIVGHHLWDVFATSIDSHSYRKYYEALDTNRAVYFEDYYPPLNKWYEISAYPSENGLSVYFKDITERKKAEEAIQLSNERYNLVTKATNDAIWDWNLQTNEVVRTGEGFTTLFGYDLDEANNDDNFWATNTHPEDLQKVIDKRELSLKDPNANYWEDEYRFKKFDGQYAHVFDRGYIIRNPNGVALRVIGATQDVSRLKENETQLKELNDQLQKWAKELSDSNAELEQFAYVASHDLQEPLRMVTSFLTQLEKRYEHLLDEKGKKYIFFAVDGATRMRQIILDLLEYSRVGRMNEHKENIDLNGLMQEIELLFSKQIEDKGAIIQAAPLPILHAHKTPIRQVFQNLISNALKYTGQNKQCKITITTKELPLHWQFMVKDNGIGISPRYFEKIFVIFQRLHNKDEFSGTGMGLAICKKIVEQNGGEIWVESEEGKGSTFYFTIKK